MKQVFVAVALLIVSSGLQAQKLDKAKDYLGKGKLLDAKTEVENFLNVEKNKGNSEAYYIKGKVYLAMAKDPALKTTVTDARGTAFEMLKTYLEMESKQKDSTKRNLFMTMDNNSLPFDLYKDYSADGAAYYGENKFSDAVVNFGKCLDIFDFLLARKMVNVTFDTTTNLYAGIAAEKAKQMEDAAKYYGNIANKRIKSEGFVEIYKWMGDHYSKKGDLVNASKYLQLGREVYPEDSFWDAFELEMIQEKATKEELFKKYEEIIARNPKNHLFLFNYGVELYQTGYSTEVAKRPENSKELVSKAQQMLKKCLELKPDYVNAIMVIGQIIYNEGVDINTDMKAIRPPAGGKLKPEELKKKDDLRKATAAKFDEALPYFIKIDELLGGMGKLKLDDKNVLKDCYDTMIIIYENKNDKDKAAIYTDKYNAVDKKHS